ncbi:MAG TPA: hypothetical protein VMQ45_10050 [Burkholderiaceae bacterium]|nr:hypothetical protein [Burkholderiaceae bacterium]
MNALRCALTIFALGLSAAALSAEGTQAPKDDPGVTISSPAEGAKVGLSGIKVSFETTQAPKGDHVHVFVDGEQVAELRQLKGTYTVDKLTAGRHWVCFRVVDKGHTPVGAEKCVTLNAGNVPPMVYESNKPESNKAESKKP